MKDVDWGQLSYDVKNERLFLEQKKTLELFLERGAISQEQFDQSLRDLTAKMHINRHSASEDPLIVL